MVLEVYNTRGEPIPDDQQTEWFVDFINECGPSTYAVLGKTRPTADVIKDVDPIAFKEYMIQYIDSLAKNPYDTHVFYDPDEAKEYGREQGLLDD